MGQHVMALDTQMQTLKTKHIWAYEEAARLALPIRIGNPTKGLHRTEPFDML